MAEDKERSKNSDRGAVGLASVTVAALVGLFGIGIADVGVLIRARGVVSSAADAAALAAADAATWLNDADPRAEAQRITDAYGVVLASCECDEGSPVTIRVETTVDARFLPGRKGIKIAATATAAWAPWIDSWSPE